MGARQCYSTIVVRPAGAAEDTVLSNRVARGGRQRLTPDGQRRLACPNLTGPKTGAAEQAAPLLFAPERVVILMNGGKCEFAALQRESSEPAEAAFNTGYRDRSCYRSNLEESEV